MVVSHLIARPGKYGAGSSHAPFSNRSSEPREVPAPGPAAVVSNVRVEGGLEFAASPDPRQSDCGGEAPPVDRAAMDTAAYEHASYREVPPLRRRAASLFLALVANGLLVVMLLSLATTGPFGSKGKGGAIIVQLLPDSTEAPTRDESRAERKQPKRAAAERSVAPEVVRPPTPLESSDVPDDIPLKMLVVSREMYAASDISKLAKNAPEGTGADSGASASGAGGPGDSAPAGTAPNGERLYNADWYRRPTHAQLSTYLPTHGPRVGWGLIACRTVANYRVEDCQEIADSPPGSGLASAVRQAAWQFLVRPPRIGGKSMVGAWVSIRIEFMENRVR